VVNSSLSHETFYRQANCISLSKALSIVSKYSPLYSSFEIFVADRPLSAWLHSYGWWAKEFWFNCLARLINPCLSCNKTSVIRLTPCTPAS
jgi:hypothetical protein